MLPPPPRYALVALCMGLIKGDHSFIASSESSMVRSASRGILVDEEETSEAAAAVAP